MLTPVQQCNLYFNACTMHLLFLFQPTITQIYITTVSLYIMYTLFFICVKFTRHIWNVYFIISLL